MKSSKTNLIKQVSLFFTLIFVFGTTYSQNLETLAFDDYQMIKPSKAALITLLNLSKDDWNSKLQELNFEKMTDSNDNTISYQSGVLLKEVKVQVISRSSETLCIQFSNFIDDMRIMDDLKNELKDYFVENKNSLSIFKIKEGDCYYKIALRINNKTGIEEVYIKKAPAPEPGLTHG